VRDAVLGQGPPPVDPADGVRAVRLVEAARRSAEQGEVVRLTA
jgi:predicted dehydrogenase